MKTNFLWIKDEFIERKSLICLITPLQSCSLGVLGDSLSSVVGDLHENSLEKSGDHTSDEWRDEVDWHVHQLLWWSIWVGMSVEESLEDSLDEADGWVDAATRDAGGDLDGSVESEADGESVDWGLLGSVVLDDLEDEANEEEGHDTLNEEHLEGHLSTIVAAVSWAELGDVVGSGDWEGLVILRKEDHGSSAEEASEPGSNELEEHHNLTVNDAEWKVIMLVLDHHTNCNSWIEMTA
jgi:hypothetical protein